MEQLHLVKYDAMCAAIAECYRVDEAKELRDKARAVQVYAQQAMNVDAERMACAIRVRAERRVGQLLKQMKESGERASVGRPSKSSCDTSISDLGISYDQSSKWQQLADIPDDKFEEALNHPGVMPSTAGILSTVENKSPNGKPRIDDHALWLWGTLYDIEKMGLTKRSLAEVMSTMTAEMRADTIRLTPLLVDWLKEGV